MPDLLQTFRDKAEGLMNSINRKGGVRSTIESLRRQMESADRRRAMTKVKSELKELEKQINEMITAVGIQAVGLHESGKLESAELKPLCQHIIELKAVLAQQQAELAKLEAVESAQKAPTGSICPSCGKPQQGDGTFCPYCGAALPTPQERYCSACGSKLRPDARFCAKCGMPVGDTP